ncbi:hypothetical protein B4129_0949 [Bacillus safensis]|nr:hypothetical protein B4129_0949 [Bacillus safensis]
MAGPIPIPITSIICTPALTFYHLYTLLQMKKTLRHRSV